DRAATHLDRLVGDLELVHHGPGRAVEPPLAQRSEHRLGGLLAGAHPRPGEGAVIAGLVGVVRRDREEAAAALERLVPVERRIAAADLELAARVPDLDPHEPVAALELV